MRPQGRLHGRILRHAGHRHRGRAGHPAPAGERVREHAGRDRATLLEARRPRAVREHDRRRRLPAAVGRALGMGHAHHARVSPRCARPLARRAVGHRGGRRVHVRHLHRLARELAVPVVAAADRRGHDARLAHGRVPVPAALSGDVLRRGVPHAHPAVAPAARDAAQPVARRGVRARAGAPGGPGRQRAGAACGPGPVGDGPYRFVAWRAGESLELAADSTFFLGRPHIRRLIWRFTPDQQVAVTQLNAGDADAVEVLVTPDNRDRARADSQLAIYPYKGAAFGYLGFNFAAPGDTTKPHPLFGDRALRRALVMAVDRGSLLHNVFGDMAKVPPGPMSQLFWIWDPETRELPHDSARAARTLTRLGWTDSDGDGIRDRDGHPLAFRLLVPTTSAVRRQYARLLQEQFRTMGIDVQLDEVDFSVFSERARAGKFDALIAVWNTDPTPSSSVPQTWTRAGFGRSNYRRFENPALERLVDRAVTSDERRDEARRTWRAAIEILNQDAPAVFLFATENAAAVHKRVADVRIRPASWLALVRAWRIPPDRLTDRDRVER